MKIIYSLRFEDEFLEVYRFIAFDSPNRADDFMRKVKQAIDSIVDMPYKHRKSNKLNDESVRELVFKGYIIPFKIEKDKILILGIFNQNLWDV